MATASDEVDVADALNSLPALQRVDIKAADSLESDRDFAFRLQLREGLMIHHPSSSSSTSPPPPPPNDAVSPTFASLESEILSKLERELAYIKQAKLEMQRERENHHRRIHDHNFAKVRARLLDDEWEESGDIFEKPLCASYDEDDGYFFKIYSKGMMTEELVDGEKVSLAGIGVVICDQMDNLIFELKKPLIESGLNKNAAEIKALIEGLTAAASLKLTRVRVLSDCLPLCQFVTGRWPAKQRKIAALVDRVSLQKKNFECLKLRHVAIKKMKNVFELARDAINSQITAPVEPNCDKIIIETCDICLEDTDVRHMFSIDRCRHRYCFSCMKKHVEEKLRQGMEPKCPHEGCKTKLIVESCRKFLTLKLFEIWNQHMKEALIPLTEKVYCPYPKCSSLMSKGEIERGASSSYCAGRRFGARKCTKCHRRFCMNCKVPWHNNMSCSYYKRLNPPAEDVKLKSLASRNQWRQCTKCNHMIELSEGCFHMTCRCGHEFCYNCGAGWKNKKATCSCPLWVDDNIMDDDSDSDSNDDDDDDDENEYEDQFEAWISEVLDMDVFRRRLFN